MYSPLRFLPLIARKYRPIHLTFFVTKKCNQRCRFCFYLKKEQEEQQGQNMADPPALLSLKEIELISRSMGSLLWVAFSGGEIFLRDDLVDISRIIYRHNRPSIMLYPTNGMEPELILGQTTEILKHCKQSIIAVKLSIDGLKDKHDSIRGVPGSFENVMKTYEALGPLLGQYSNFELGVNTLFFSENQDDMSGIISFVKGLDMIKTHTVSLVRGDLREGGLKHVDVGKYLEAATELEQGLRSGESPTYGFSGAKIKAAQDILQRRLIHRTVTEQSRQLPCYAGRLNVVLTENGDVYPCEAFEKKLGNVRETAFDVVEFLKAHEEDIRPLSESCFCSHECFMMTNILFNPRMYPALLGQYMRLGQTLQGP